MNLSFLKDKKNKYIIFALLALLVLVIVIPTSTEEKSGETTVSEDASEREMEAQLKRVLSAMEGVGEVEVMITFETEENSLFGTTATKGKVCGVVVVAEGAAPKGGNITVEGTRNNGKGVDNTKLGGVGQIVAKQLEELTGL